MLGISHFSVNPLVASYAIHLGAGALIMGILTGLFFGVALSMRPVAGPVITKFDKRKLMILVFVIGGIANIGYALFHNISAFILFRIIHGVQYSLVGTLTMTLAGDNLPKEKMASGMGIYGLCGSIGMAIGPTIGLYLLNLGTHSRNESFGFTFVFLFAVISSFIGIIPSTILVPDKKTERDVLSTGAWYTNIASVHAVPMSILMFLIFVGWSLYNIYIVEFAKELEISGISSFYTVLAAVLMITRPASGWLTDRFGLARILPPSFILFAVSFLIVGFGKSIGTMLAGAAIASLGFGSFQPALFSMCILSETPLKRSVASNTLYIGIDLGLFLGPIMGSMVYGMYDYSVMYKSASLMIFLALVVFILLLPAYHRRRRVLEAMETE
ncbi:MAG: MFS transporter [Deltaproteobacteria bacterium]|nr:MFS transporter [Deltaproteobacteria bacterium]